MSAMLWRQENHPNCDRKIKIEPAGGIATAFMESKVGQGFFHAS
jgi:hypothetical protein